MKSLELFDSGGFSGGKIEFGECDEKSLPRALTLHPPGGRYRIELTFEDVTLNSSLPQAKFVLAVVARLSPRRIDRGGFAQGFQTARVNAPAPQTRFDPLVRQRSRAPAAAALSIALLVLGLASWPRQLALDPFSHLDTNLLNQAGATLPRFQALREASETFGGETFVAVVWIPDQHSDEDVTALKEVGSALCHEMTSAAISPLDFDIGNADPDSFRSVPCLNNVACSTQQFAEQARSLALAYPQLLLRAEDIPLLRAQFEPAGARCCARKAGPVDARFIAAVARKDPPLQRSAEFVRTLRRHREAAPAIRCSAIGRARRLVPVARWHDARWWWRARCCRRRVWISAGHY